MLLDREHSEAIGFQDYQYHLAPVFSVAQDLFGEFTVLLRIRILLTDTWLALALHAAKSRRNTCVGAGGTRNGQTGLLYVNSLLKETR